MERKQKILYVITKGNFGGAQKYVYDLATHLPQEQFEVVVACGQGETLKQKLTEKNIRVIELPDSERDINFFKDLKTFFDILKIIKEERPDIINLNSSKIGGLGSLAGRFGKVPKIIFTAHGWAFNEKRSTLSKFIIIFLHWITVFLSHQTIAVSQKTKNDLAWLPFIKQKITVIHNGIENFKFVSKEESRLKLAPQNEGKILIYSISEMHQNKGLDIALKALSLLPSNIREQILYIVAGSGEEKKKLEKLAHELKVDGITKFFGFVDNAKQYLKGADIFLFPSRNENLPFAILEAGLAGLPIIATSVGGIPEIIVDMQNGILVHPNKPKEIAEAILYYLEHPKKQKEFSKNIRETVSNSFSLEKMLQHTINVYKV